MGLSTENYPEDTFIVHFLAGILFTSSLQQAKGWIKEAAFFHADSFF